MTNIWRMPHIASASVAYIMRLVWNTVALAGTGKPIVTLSLLCTLVFMAGAVLDANRDTRWRSDPLALTPTSSMVVSSVTLPCISEDPKWDRHQTDRKESHRTASGSVLSYTRLDSQTTTQVSIPYSSPCAVKSDI
jgi:hypothetical protein